MSKRKKSYYAVRIGKIPGVYNSWNECKAQIEGFSGAIYKGFSTKKEAEEYLSGKNNDKCISNDENDVDITIFVDGSFDNDTGVYGYAFVAIFKDGTIKEFCGANNDTETARLRNVAGEMLGAMFAVRYAKNKKCKSVLICHDYLGIERWASGTWKAKNRFTSGYADYMRKYGKEIDISYKKVDAHTGVKYNERADQLAKYAVYNFGKDE